MKTKLIALLCLCAVMLYASAQLADQPISQQDGEKIGVMRTTPYAVPEGYPNHGARDGRAILMSEDFEAGMPAGWTVIDGNLDGYTWMVGTTTDLLGNDPPAYGTAYAYYSDDNAGSLAPAGNEYFISPAVYCSGYGNLVLSFGWGFYIYSTPYGAAYARFHDGTSWGAWNLLATYYVNDVGVDTFYLAAYLPADSMQIQFTYEDPYAGWGWAFGVDNVFLEEPPEYDVGCTAVASPPEGSVDPDDYDVIGVIENFGQHTETFNATANVYDTDGMVTIFSATQSVTLASGASTNVNFGSVYLPIDKYFYTEIYTQLGTDEESSNDTAFVETRTALGLGDIVFEMDIQTPCGDNQLLGLEFDGTYFYITGGGNAADPNKVYVLDTDGNLIWTMDQVSWSTSWGWRDLTWDEAYAGADRIDTLYASVNAYVDKFGIDLTNGTLQYYSSFPGLENPNRGLAYDGDDGWFFTANFSSNCHKFTKYGVWLQSVTNTYAVYGAAYDTDDAEGGWVWWHSQDDPGTGYGLQISQMDAATMAWTGVIAGYVPAGLTAGIAGGMCFYEGWNGMDVLFCLVQGTPVDEIVGVFVRYDVPAIAADVEFSPNHLNLKSKGNYVTCFIEPEEGYDAADIDVGTVAISEINGTPITPIYAVMGSAEIGDHDYDGIPDLKVKFPRGMLIGALETLMVFGYADLTVTGEVTGEGEFAGTYRIILLHEATAYNGRQGYTGIPRSFALYEGQPNPFNSSTMITYAVPQATGVTLQIYDATGRMVKELVDDVVAPGYYNVRWDAKDDAGKDVASGVYFLKFDAGTYRADGKLLLVK